jgi:7-carboxy-7-deazaguanine synthase
MRVAEIFHSIQGESTWAGRPCTFVRLTGCPLRCRWCDTEYAFEGGTAMDLSAVLAEVDRFGCPLVEVTGGEPLVQKECPELLRALCDRGYEVLLETSGAVSTEKVDSRVVTILDLKCPDSGESERNLWENVARLRPRDEIKFVIASRRDYEWALETVRDRDLSARNVVLFSPVWGELEPGRLAGWILADRAPVRMQIQLHKILFGADVAGV